MRSYVLFAAAPWQRRSIFAVLILFFVAAADAHQYVRVDYNLTLNSRSRHTTFLEVFDDRPLTQANFMQYVNAGKYDASLMHRLSRDFVLQGGGFYFKGVLEESLLGMSLDPTAEVDLDGNPATDNPSVNNEYSLSPTRSNIKGTVAMAKVAGDPNSATSQWFVNLGNNTGLDTNNGGFTVFAQVLGEGMTYYDAINSPTLGADIHNFNPDIDDDGDRDGGPFFNYSAPLDNDDLPTDGVPAVGVNLLLVQKAKRIDYYGGTGASTTLNVPASDYTISTRDVFIDAGASVTGTGKLIVGAGRELGVREGITLARPVVNHGTLAMGLDNGVLTVPTFEQSAQGTLDIDIRGTTLDTQYDRLIVTGAAQLSGKLKFDLLNLYQPTPANTFTIMTAASFTGNFTSFEGSPLTRFLWGVEKTATEIRVKPVAGDYNGDGNIDGLDYATWRNQMGTTFQAAYSGADGNGDKTVNAADFDVWKKNLGFQNGDFVVPGAGSGGLAAVPEPAAGVMLILGSLSLSAMRKRRPESR